MTFWLLVNVYFEKFDQLFTKLCAWLANVRFEPKVQLSNGTYGYKTANFAVLRANEYRFSSEMNSMTFWLSFNV